ncbi:hypothetical protein HY946_01290, partial [Candidatus Gottesmanbacteria bacterium]|nr:hypothetical protein [Candidatus Gottesmanbacteria bacterium]
MDLALQLGKTILIKPFLLSFLITLVSTPFVIRLAKYWGLVDDPKKRKHPAHTETRIIPRAGGISIFFGILVGSALSVPFSKQLAGILLGAAIIVGTGIVDDKLDLNPYLRFVTNIVAATLAVGAGVGIAYVTNPFGPGVIHLDTLRFSFNFLGNHSVLILADLLAVLWIIWCMNMV